VGKKHPILSLRGLKAHGDPLGTEKRTASPGPEDTFIGYGRGWANVSNTPFREYKHFAHEGEITTPLIAHWPKGIGKRMRGEIDHQPGHLIDLMATCVDLAGLKCPQKYGDYEVDPLEGVSLAPAFRGKPQGRKGTLFFEHHLKLCN